jgi:hypothetical protein
MTASAGLLATALLGCRTGPPEAVVSHLDVSASVAGEGTTYIQERMTVRPTGTVPLPSFVRHIEASRADQIVFDEASLDGRVVRSGAGLDVSGDPTTLDVRWALPATPDAHDLGLRYHLRGALEISGSHARLVWNAIPARRSFTVTDAQLSASVLPTADVFALTGIDQAGWAVTRRPDGFSATRQVVPSGEPATIVLELSVPDGTPEPLWQIRADRSEQLMPSFVSGGLFILVIGAGILWIVRFQYPRRHGADIDAERAAVWAAMRRGGRVTLALAVVSAVTIHLAMRTFGPWPQAISISIAVVGIALEVAGRWFK